MRDKLFRSVELEEGPLYNRTAEQIKELIVSGKLAEGEQLPSERELCERLGVSRTVVREAIKLLGAGGLVRVKLGVGTFVTGATQNILKDSISFISKPASKKIFDLQQARESIEPAIAVLAARNASPDDLSKMGQAVKHMEEYSDDAYEYVRWNTVFHNSLAEASQNSVLQLMMHSIVDLLQEASRMVLLQPGAAERSNRIHRRILRAVEAGNANQARQAMSEHLRLTTDDLTESMNESRSVM